MEGDDGFGAAGDAGVDACGADERFALAGPAGGTAGPPPDPAAGLEAGEVPDPAGLGIAGLTGRAGLAGRGELAPAGAPPVGAAGLGGPAKGLD